MPVHLCDAELTRILNLTTGEIELPYSPSDLEQIINDQVWPTFWDTPTGEAFAETYRVTDALKQRIAAELLRRFGRPGQIGPSWPGAMTCARLEQIIGDLMRLKDRSLTPINANLNSDGPALTEADKFAALVKQARNDMDSPTVSTAEIKKKREQSPEYERAFQQALADSVKEGEANSFKNRGMTPPALSTGVPATAKLTVEQFGKLLRDHLRELGQPRPMGGFVSIHADWETTVKDGQATSRTSKKEYRFPALEFRQLADQAAVLGLLD